LVSDHFETPLPSQYLPHLFETRLVPASLPKVIIVAIYFNSDCFEIGLQPGDSDDDQTARYCLNSGYNASFDEATSEVVMAGVPSHFLQ
jgi:hypothetical protein